MKHVWNIKFKSGTSTNVVGPTLSKAIIASRLKPFLVVDVHSITQTK